MHADRVRARLAATTDDPVELGVSGIELSWMSPYAPDNLAAELVRQIEEGSSHVPLVPMKPVDPKKKVGAC